MDERKEKFKFYAALFCFLILFVFLVQKMFVDFTDAFLLNSSLSFSQPWRFFTSIFLHADLAHLLYNLLALAFFGSILEKLIGGRGFIFVFFVSGIFANLVSVNFYSNSLGASGAIFGVIGALIFVRPWLTVWVFSLPMPIIFAGVLWAVIDFVGIFAPTSVANIAHLSGMFFGLLFGAFYRFFLGKGVKAKKRKNFEIDEESVRVWEDRYLR